MAITYTDNGGGSANGSKLEFTYTFPVLQTEDVKVALNNVVQATTKYAVDTASNPTKITFNNTSVDTNVQESTGAPKTGVDVRVFRQTQVGKSTGDDDPKAVYAAGSSIRATDLNANTEQALYAIHELQDQPLTDQDIEDGAITSAKIADGTIANVDVSSTAAIDGTKISPDFGSQNIATTGTVDGRDVSVDGTKLDTIETSATADQTAAEIKTLYESNSNTNAYTDVEKAFINGITATSTDLNIIDGVTATTAELNYVDGVTSDIQTQIDGKQPLDAELTELATMGSGTAGALADLNTAEVQILDGATASTAELNLLAGKSIVTTIGGSATDVQIPSAQAVNERIVELVTEVGGFAPIANETSFPTTNPDINNGAGTIVSIKGLASNLVANSSGVATIANGAGTGNTVTINGLGNAQTIVAGRGILVETTSTLHTYTFHREAMDGTAITNASVLVSDFNDRYQISASAPSTHPDGSALGDGDLWFDTASNIMKVYDLGNTQYDAVTSVGDFKLLTVVPDGATSGSPTFDGNIVSYDLRDDTNAANVTSVGQLIVSLNGVIQKPNAGSYNASNEGFYLEGSNGIKFCTAPASGSSLFVTLIGAATSIGTPSDNTITEAKLQSDSVSEGKLKVSNSPINGYFLSAQSGNTGGLTWAQVNTELVGDTSPQLGGELDSNNFDIKLTDGEKLKLHDHGTIGTKTTATNAVSGGLTGYVLQNSTVIDSGSYDIWLSSTGGKKITFGTSDSTTHEVMRVQCAAVGASQHGFVNLNYVTANAGGNASSATKLATTATGVTVTGTVAATSFTGDGSNLTGLQAGATGGNSGANAIFWENQQTVTHDYSISANRNAGSFGPIAINSGITVTVPSTSNWTIV